MDLNTLLSSIIAAASIIIAVSIPFLIDSFTDYNRKRNLLLSEMKASYHIFNSYRELIYNISQIDFWKNRTAINNYNTAILKGDKKEISILIDNNEFLSLYQVFKYISDQYSYDALNNRKRIFTYNELLKYQNCANKIWYAIDCHTDFKAEMNIGSFEEINEYKLKKIKKIISKISSDYEGEKLSIDLIANISGEMETTIIDNLSDLALQYEQPLKPIIKIFYGVLWISLVFGVIVPLFLLLFTPNFIFITTVIVVFIMIICLTVIMYFTGKYIGII
ncbi:MAG: hypothetical protein ACOXZO_10970 [Bacteroidales bacterium]|jgi:hypothetical protein|nr:hypothetical protein [Bacteroidales bacterium]